MTATAYRSAAAARAWRAGITLARLLQQHDVPRPAQIKTTAWRSPEIAGTVTLEVGMQSAADLLRLARVTERSLQICPGAGDCEQMYIHNLVAPPAQINAYWVGPVTASAS